MFERPAAAHRREPGDEVERGEHDGAGARQTDRDARATIRGRQSVAYLPRGELRHGPPETIHLSNRRVRASRSRFDGVE
jgi:hypothetical protein